MNVNSMPINEEVKIIYSLRIKALLSLQGFEPLLEMDHPKKEGFKCWVYEATPSFLDFFDSIMKGGTR